MHGRSRGGGLFLWSKTYPQPRTAQSIWKLFVFRQCTRRLLGRGTIRQDTHRFYCRRRFLGSGILLIAVLARQYPKHLRTRSEPNVLNLQVFVFFLVRLPML